MATILVFRSMKHYSDWLYKLRLEKTANDIKNLTVENPKKFVINILRINWGIYLNLTKDWRSGKGCPFCFWNNVRCAYLEPKFVTIKLPNGEKKSIIQEDWTICPCRLYDPDCIDLIGKKGDKREVILDLRSWFSHLAIDWNEWCRSLNLRQSNGQIAQNDELLTKEMEW